MPDNEEMTIDERYKYLKKMARRYRKAEKVERGKPVGSRYIHRRKICMALIEIFALVGKLHTGLSIRSLVRNQYRKSLAHSRV